MQSIIVNGNKLAWEEGMTIRRILVLMNYSFPMLIIKINGTLIKRELWDSTLVPAGADVIVYHLISGG